MQHTQPTSKPLRRDHASCPARTGFESAVRLVILSVVLLTHTANIRAQGGAPYQWLNVKTFGATGNGSTDDTVAITAALATAKLLSGSPAVYFPAGTYRYTQNITVDGVAVYGEGKTKTFLESAASNRTSWKLTGSFPLICDLTIRTALPVTARDTRPEATGLDVYQAQDFVVSRVAIGPVAGAGMLVRESGGTTAKPAVIRDCQVRNTLADGIHVTARSHNIDIDSNDISETGDDMIAVVSIRFHGDLCRFIRIANNLVAMQTNGRGISVVGGQNVTIDSNFIEMTYGAGIYVASEASYDTYGASNIAILNNTLTGVATNTALGHGAIHLSGRINTVVGDDSLKIKNVTITGNHVQGAGRSGLYIGSYTSAVAVIGNDITNAATSAIFIGTKTADIAIGSATAGSLPNIIKSCGEYGIRVDPAGGQGVLRISGVLLQSINTKNLGYIDAINISGNGTFPSTFLTDNRLEQRAGLTVERLIESQSPVTEALRNTANIVLGSVIPN